MKNNFTNVILIAAIAIAGTIPAVLGSMMIWCAFTKDWEYLSILLGWSLVLAPIVWGAVYCAVKHVQWKALIGSVWEGVFR